MHKVNCLIKWWWVLKYLWNIWCQIKWHRLHFFFLVEKATALSMNSLLSLKTRCWSFECWFICVWLPWWKAVIFCLCCPQDGSALSTGWTFPFAQVQFACIIPSKSPATPGWLEGAMWLLHNSISNLLFFYISSSKSGNHSGFRSMSASHFNPRYLLQSFPGPPNLAGVRSGWPSATRQKPSSWTRSCPPAGPRVPSRLWTL